MTGQPVSPPPLPANEAQRRLALEKYRLGGIGREAAFDHITQLATELFDVPIALVSIIGSDTQCFRGACGIEESSTSRDVAFCAFTILQKGVMAVADARTDLRFQYNPLVTGDPHIRFYAGAPLIVGGHALGTLCLVDHQTRDFTPAECDRLARLARTVVDMIELRVERFVAEEQRQLAAKERELLRLTVENANQGVALFDGDLKLAFWNSEFVDLFGFPAALMVEGTPAVVLMRLVAERGEFGRGDPMEIVATLLGSIRETPARRMAVQRIDGRMLDVSRRTISGGRFIVTARDATDKRPVARLGEMLVLS